MLVNAPFSGTLVPLSRYRKDARVSSIMVEVNKGLYMDERTGERLPSFHWLRRVLLGYLELAAETAMPARG